MNVDIGTGRAITRKEYINGIFPAVYTKNIVAKS
jgi:hypothetical protein